MDNRTGLFCSLLKAGLWNETLDIRLDKDEFKSVWNDATRQVTRGLIASALVSSNAVPPKVVDRLQDHLLKIAGENLKMGNVLAQSVEALRREGIDPVLLKGHGVASFYKVPMLRESGDIDLYVGQVNYRKAFDTLVAMTEAPESFEFEEHSKHSHVEINGITVELHRFCEVLPRRYDRFFQDVALKGLSTGLDHVTYEDITVSTPEPTFNAFFLFNHLWRHFVTEGVGLRQVCDWTMFLHAKAGEIDRSRLESILRSLDLLKAWQVFGRVAVDVLGLPSEEMPFDEPSYSSKVPGLVAMMIKEGNFGHEREDWWTVPRESFFDKVHVFFMIAQRYFGLVPTFGSVVVHEYLDRMRRKFLG